MANFFSKLFGSDNGDLVAVENQLDRTTAELDKTHDALAQTQAELDALKAAPAPEPETIEIPVIIEQLTGVVIQSGSSKNQITKERYEAAFGGIAPVSQLVSEMFEGISLGTIASATLVAADGTVDSVAVDSILPKVMPARIVVNTVLGEGGAQ